MRGAAAVLLAVAASACGTSTPSVDAGPGVDAGGPTFLGQFDQPTPIELVSWIPQVSIGLGSVSAPALIDTGSPLVVLDSDAFGVSGGPQALALTAFGGTIQRLPVVAFDLFPSAPGGFPTPQGLLGGSLWIHFGLVLDYRAALASLEATGDSVLPAQLLTPGLDAPVPVACELRGGGTAVLPGCGTGCPFPPTRGLVQAVVEGQPPVWMMVDTGTSWVVLEPAFADGLPATGRPRLGGITLDTAAGPRVTYMTRLASLSVGGAVDTSEPVLVAPDASLFDALSAETGVTVVGLIGGGFLRWWVVFLDCQAGHLALARYEDPSHIDPQEFVGVGFTLFSGGASWVVADVYTGSSAESVGLVSGDVVTDLDGVPLAGLDASTVAGLLSGRPVGDVVTVGVQRGAARVELDVGVEDLLPAFTGP